MGVLNTWQRLDRVLSGKPFGDGSAGSATISSDPNTRATITGTATQTTSTIGSAILSNGDVVLIHQSQGTGHGQWEFNRVASGGGGTSITWQTALKYTYGTGAQVIKIPMYTTATVNAHSPTAWNGTTGGIEIIVARTSITVSGALSGNGKGFVGGSPSGDPGPSSAGEGANANPGSAATGAGQGVSGAGPGSGGGYGTDGIDTLSSGKQGLTYGSADLSAIDFGGGGSGGTSNPQPGGSGGASGSPLVLISDSITLSAGVTANGANATGGGGGKRGNGGGSGSAILMICRIATLGSNNATATKGTGSTGDVNGGDGGAGRIAVHHFGTVTGTTNPTFTDVSDTTLIESSGTMLGLI